MFSILQEVGACAEDLWPYDPPDGIDPDVWIQTQPKLAAFEVMSDNKLLGWSQIFELDDALLDAVDCSVYANHPVVYGTAIDAPFRDYDGSGIVLVPPENPDDIIGRHAIAIFGRRLRQGRREYWIRNSWDKDWGMNGHVWVDQSYVTWSEAMNHTVGTYCADIIS